MAEMERTSNITENNINNAGTPIDGTAYNRPKSLLGAIGEIQRLYTIELRSSEPIDKEYFTIEQVWDFFKVGFKNGFIESFILVTLLPFLQTIYPSVKLYFFGESITDQEKLILSSFSYLPIVATTIFLLFLGKYYKGNLTRRALFSLFTGRSFAFALKGGLVYWGLLYLSKISYKDPNVIYNLVDWTKFLFDLFLPMQISSYDLYVYYYKFVIPALKMTANEILWTMIIFAILPYLTIFLKGVLRKRRYILNKEHYENY